MEIPPASSSSSTPPPDKQQASTTEAKTSQVALTLLERRGHPPLAVNVKGDSFAARQELEAKRNALWLAPMLEARRATVAEVLIALGTAEGSFVKACITEEIQERSLRQVFPEDNLGDQGSWQLALLNCIGSWVDRAERDAEGPSGFSLEPLNKGHSRAQLLKFSNKPVAIIKSLSLLPSHLLNYWERLCNDSLKLEQAGSDPGALKEAIVATLTEPLVNAFRDGVAYYEMAYNELLADTLFSALGVPTTLLVNLPGLGTSSIHRFIADAINPLEMPQEELEAALEHLELQSAQNTALVHMRMLNQDVHLGNLLLRPKGSKYELIPVDHAISLSRQFPLSMGPQTPCWYQWPIMDEPLTDTSWNSITKTPWDLEKLFIKDSAETVSTTAEEVLCFTHHCFKKIIKDLGRNVSPRDLYYGMCQIEKHLLSEVGINEPATESEPMITALNQQVPQDMTREQFFVNGLGDIVGEISHVTKIT